MNSEELKKLSPEELAETRWGYKDNTPVAILIEKEFERRARIEQHELDLKLVLKQVRWMKFSVIATILSALLGIILGAYLQRNWPTIQPTMPKQLIEPQTLGSTSAHQPNVSKSSSHPPKETIQK
jgi:hypothetical protein